MKTNQSQKNIHSEWQQVKLGVVCDISAGGTPSTDVLEYWEQGNIPWANSAEINKKNICQTENFITDEGLKNSSAKIVPVNSVLIALAGQGSTRGKVAVNKISLTTNQSIAFFIPKKDISYSFLRSDLERRYQELRSISAGDGGRGGLNLQILKSIKINLPSLPEQNRIVSVLETWDKAIEKLSEKIEAKKQIKKGLMQDLLTGKKRLKGFSSRWENIRLGDVGQVVTGNTPSKKKPDYYGGEFLWATALDFQGVYIENTEIKLSESGKNVSRIVPSGSVLVTCIASIGKNAIAKKPMSFNQQINAIIPSKKHNSEFIYYLIENSFHKLKEVAGGGALAMISKGVFEKIRLKFPNLEEQKAIAKILTTADNEIQELEKKLQIIKDQKKYLLNNLITGTIRTPETLSAKPIK